VPGARDPWRIMAQQRGDAAIGDAVQPAAGDARVEPGVSRRA
jgi:hypothetical protein